jgi:peptide/nickel transport system ATP-binding protein
MSELRGSSRSATGRPERSEPPGVALGAPGAPHVTSSELLSVRGLRVDFVTDRGVAQVLDGVNLDIGQGEVVGLVGESGCGKTTLARAILGILPPGAARIRGGEVRYRGQDLLRADPAAVNDRVRGRAITFIPQDPFTSFSPVFPVQTQIMDLMKWKSPRAENRDGAPSPFRRYPRGRYRADREVVLETLRAVQIPEPARAMRRLPHEFSGGQRQRLMIAMALLPRPDLIIADEPTTALDVTIQAQILRLLRALVKERGVSVLFTTHDLGTAHEICDRIVVMYAGQEMEAAPTAAFFSRPAHPYTRRLLASVPSPDGEIRDIPGEVPSLIEPPAGCRFHPRCAYASMECRTVRPAPRTLAAAHAVGCYHPLDASIESDA